MSLNIDSFKKNYWNITGVKGINFEPLKSGSVIPRPYFSEKGAAILVTITEDKVEITPNGLFSAVKLLASMEAESTVKMEYRTRPYEGGEPFPDLYAGSFVTSVLGYLKDNGNDVRHVFEEYNSSSTNYLRYVSAMENGANPISALQATWGGMMMRKNKFRKAELITPENAWMSGGKIQVIYSK